MPTTFLQSGLSRHPDQSFHFASFEALLRMTHVFQIPRPATELKIGQLVLTGILVRCIE